MASHRSGIKTLLWLSAIAVFCTVASSKRVRYTPDWPSLDSRPLPEVRIDWCGYKINSCLAIDHLYVYGLTSSVKIY